MDKKTAKDEAPPRILPPAGVFPGRCVDGIDLGLNPESFQGNPKVLKDKYVLVYRFVDDEGKVHDQGREFTFSFGPKANLRKWCEQWRNKAYTDAEAKAGAPIEKFDGVTCLLTVTRAIGTVSGKEIAKLTGIAPLPKAMRDAAPSAEGYVRVPFWATKQEEYLAATRAFTQGPPVEKKSAEPTEVEDAELDAIMSDDEDTPF